MHNEFELVHNAAKTTKNICCAKGEGAVDLSTVKYESNYSPSSYG